MKFYVTLLIFIVLLYLLSIIPYPIEKYTTTVDSMDVNVDNLSCSDYIRSKNPSLLASIESDKKRKEVLEDLQRAVTPVQNHIDTTFTDLKACVLDAEKKSVYGLPVNSCTLSSDYVMDMFSKNSSYPYGCYIDPQDRRFPAFLDKMYGMKNEGLLQQNNNALNVLNQLSSSNNELNTRLNGLNSNIIAYQTQTTGLSQSAQRLKQQYESQSNNYYTLLNKVTQLGTSDSDGALSAKQIKDVTGAFTNGIYYIRCGNIPRRTFCLMDSAYDGGGWMLLMKMGIGETFSFASQHWTQPTVINENSLNITDFVDAKFDVFNGVPIKDIMVIFHKDDMNGQTGGSVPNNIGWCWILNNWYSNGQKVEAIHGFDIPRDVVPYSPYEFSGWNGNLFSTQNGVARHVIGGHGHYGRGHGGTLGDWYSVRWGFVFNNEIDMQSVDVASGIGLGPVNPAYNLPKRSAGDYYGCCGVKKLDKSVRCLVFGR